MSIAPRVDVVVVAFDSPTDRLARCAASVLASDGVNVRVVVVDNGSAAPVRRDDVAPGDASLVVTRRPRNGGFAAGVNAGLDLLTTDAAPWVFVLNDDAWVERDAIVRSVWALERAPEAASAAPRVMLAEAPDAVDSVGLVLRPNGEAFNLCVGQPWIGQVADGEVLLGPCFAAVLLRASTLDTIGRLDEGYFMYYEDVDWALRAARAGYRCVAVVDAVVHHEHAGSTPSEAEARRYRLVQRNLLLMATKNLQTVSVWRIWRGRLVTHAKGVVTGPYRWARFAAIASALVRLPRAWRVRRQRRVARPALTDAALFAFARDETPHLDVATRRPDDPAAARRDAEARRDRISTVGD